MCCTRSKLSLYLKCIREAFKHLVIRNTKLIQFFNLTFFYSPNLPGFEPALLQFYQKTHELV